MAKREPHLTIPLWRFLAISLLLCLLPVALLWHIVGLQVLSSNEKGFEFLQDQGTARTVRKEPLPAYRGVITDRRGEPLAVSTPVISLWANPKILAEDGASLKPLAKVLGIPHRQLLQRIERYRNKAFMYLERHLSPDEAQRVLNLELTGVYAQREYRRFYPAGEITAQLVGFTDIDDRGQEGIELAYEEALRGEPGARKVVKDLKGRIIKDLALVRSARPGNNLTLSIDLRLQYIAYRELKEAVAEFGATAGSVVVLDTETGEILALANQPSYNPNDRSQLSSNALRNRAITDLLEPGSTLKPFTMTAALESGKYTPESIIDTSPGRVRFGRKTYEDPVNYGVINLTRVLTKSSQVGTTKVAMTLEPEHMRDVLFRVGFGQSPGTGFPGETPGSLPSHSRWRISEHASLAFGYGLSVTPLQLAQAYGVLAMNGERRQVSLLKVEDEPETERVIDSQITRQIRAMMETVVLKGGTGTRAAIPNYKVAGKTGTVHKVGAGGYQAKHYMALFAGMAPAKNPRLVTVVVIDDPDNRRYHGGQVAAPVFSRVTSEALRLLNIAPEVPEEPPVDSERDRERMAVQQKAHRGDLS